MNPVKFIKRLIGGLNLDVNINEVAPTDFIDGYDIVDRNPRAKNEDGLLQPNLNTKLAYDLGEAEAVKKKYRVTMDLTDLASCDLLFKSTIKGLFYKLEMVSTSYVTGDDAADTFTNIQGAFAGTPDYDDSVLTLVSAVGFLLVFDIVIPFYGYTDYYLTVVNSLGDSYPTAVRIDAVSVEKEGAINPSRFANINNAQQVFATSNNKKPVYLTATASYTSSMFLTFATSPLIQSGEEVYIYSQAGGLNQFSAVVTLQAAFSPNEYFVIGTSNVSLSPSGTYVVVRYWRSLSVIGYAQKDDIKNTWTYTELVRSNKLNFKLYKQIQDALDVTSDGLLYDFTDFLNQIKRLTYKGEVQANGFLKTYNAEGLYNLDTIGEESRLQLGSNTSKVTLSVAASTGLGGKVGYSVGSKKEANYAAFVSFKTPDGAYTTYSKASNVLWLHSSSVFGHIYGADSGRALQIKVEQIPSDIYDYVRVSIIEFTTDSWVGYSLPDIPINGQETIYVGDSGFNSGSYLDFNAAATLLEEIPFVFENARSLLSYINYKLAADVNLYREYDLTEWAKTITLTVGKQEVLINTDAVVTSATATTVNILSGINDYSRCSNANMSLMPYDTYRMCVFIDWENGSPTSTYGINDVSCDPAYTGFIDVALSYTYPNIYYNQLYIEAKGIDMDYVLPDGKILRELVKDVRFGRALCNQQVYTTGLGMNVYKNGSDYYVSGLFDTGSTQVDDKLSLYSPDFQNTNGQFSFSAGDVLKLRKQSPVVTNVGSNRATLMTGVINYSPDTCVISALENITAQSDNSIALYQYTNTGQQIYIRNGAAVQTATPFNVTVTANTEPYLFYYIKEYSSEGAYPQDPTQTRFFVLPQDQWYNSETHTTSTVYKIFGGDAFPTLSAYKIAENATSGTSKNAVVIFWNYNRTNTGLRSGRYPYYTLQDYLENPYLVDPTYEGDRYTYDACFTPRYPFQNQVAFNPLLPQFTNKFSSLYYSGVGFGSDLAGGNRIWKPLNMKNIESKYGAITGIEVLLGQTGTNILIVWQERRLTAQYFDNTANIDSNTGELLIGNGEILGREGQNFTEFGCEVKWAIIKGQTVTGKDVAFWPCLRKSTIMRFGADGTSSIVADISYLINNKTLLALNNTYNNPDEPAFFNGIHATWDNLKMEYILTLRLYPKCIAAGTVAMKGDFLESPTLKWGFDQFPVIYQSRIDNNSSTPPNASWNTFNSYDSEYFEILTLVWNEMDNKFKTYRTFNPKIYGQYNGNFVSSHPTQGNLIYEHNSLPSEAIYYEVETTTSVTATTDPALYRITGAGIQSTFPSPFVPYERQKYIVKINGKKYEVVGTGTNYLQMASVDDDDILPQETITNFSYYVCNSQDPYIQGVCNNAGGRYFHFGNKFTQSDYALKRTEYEAGFDSLGTPITKSFNNMGEETFENGQWWTPIKQDTTLTPTNNEVGLKNVEGIWMKIKSIWRWGKSNKLLTTEIKALETQKTK